MKKIISFITVFLLVITLSACQKNDHRFYIDSMNTYIQLEVRTTKKNAEKYLTEIEKIFNMYHVLTDNFETLPADSIFLTNIYEINNQPNQKVEIDFELYEILEKAEEYRILTDGYFDISIGKIIDLWKGKINFENRLESNVTEEEWNELVNNLNNIEVQEDAYTLYHENNKYYVKIKNDQVKLDLGAFAKGYATQKAYEYLNNQNVKEFVVVAGGSSIYLGENYKTEDGLFQVGLLHPNRQPNDPRNYGKVYVKNNSITSSGNNEQYFVYEGKRYHHLISTITKYPEHYYYSLTMVTKDAGFADAITTAIFSMPPEVLSSWIERVKETHEFDLILYAYDNTIITDYLVNVDYEPN